MALIGAALIAGLFQLQKNPELLMPPVAESAKPEATPAGTAAVTADARNTRTSTTTAASDYARLYLESADYLSLANQLQPLAKDGDAAAQYWLSRVYQYCDQDFGRAFSFGHEGHYLTPEEVQQRWPDDDRSLDLDALRLIHRRCAELVQQGYLQFNDYDELLQAASKAGHPRAQIDFAMHLTGRGETGTSDAIKLARQALRSGEPEVVMAAALLVLTLNAPDMHTPEDEVSAAHERAGFAWNAWVLAGCIRGADCSAQAGWVRRRCLSTPACQPFETGTDLIRRERPESFDSIMLRAREINDLIDAGRWEEIEFR